VSPKHYSEDDLTLYYYSEGTFRAGGFRRMRRRRRVDRHLEECPACAALHDEISRTLVLVREPDVPARGDQYGLEVWQRIRHRLPEQDSSWLTRWMSRDRLAPAIAALVLLLAAFVAGRTWRHSSTTSSTGGPSAAAPSGSPRDAAGRSADDIRQRILLTSVADHLDRSERVLADIMNAPDREDISAEQRWAEDLLAASRLYRQDAAESGERSVAGVLDELERSLLEIVHSPSRASTADLEQIRGRIDAAALLFKVRVMSNELRRRDELQRRSDGSDRSLPAPPATKTS
jgi:hypothetical protein